MAASGTNRMVMSDVVGRKGSESALTAALSDANNEALKINRQKKNNKK